MAGKWHSIYETGKESSCVCYEFEPITKTHFHGYFYHLKQMISLDPKNPEDINEGFVVSAKFSPAMDKMTMYTFATDYEHYAGMFTCKEVGDVHFPHVAFWSRDITMTDEKMQELKEMMAKYEGVDLSGLKAVNHSECDHWEIFEKVSLGKIVTFYFGTEKCVMAISNNKMLKMTRILWYFTSP